MSEATVRLPTEVGNTGKYVRVLENTVSAVTVEQQVVSLADSAGNLIESEVQGLPAKHHVLAPSTGTLTSTGSVAVSAKGFSNFLVSVSGTYSIGGLAHEISFDGGSTYVAVRARRVDAGFCQSTMAPAANASIQWMVPVSGASHYRLRCTAYTSGTANVSVTPTAAPYADPGALQQNWKFRDLKVAVQAIKATDGCLRALQINNSQAAVAFIQVFNVAAGSVTPGTTVPDWEGAVPASVNREFVFPGEGMYFSSAISIISATAAGGGSASASGVHAHAQYL